VPETAISSPKVLENRSPKSRYWQEHTSGEIIGEILFLASSSFYFVAGCIF